MKRLRPYIPLVALSAGLFLASAAVRAQARQAYSAGGDSASRSVAVAPGYLGVDIVDVDAAKAQALKLKNARGAVITLIDHDAPAGQVGLRVNDVVLQLDGQNIDNAGQFRSILKNYPAGRKITLEISRAGDLETVSVALVDPKQMEQRVWHTLRSSGGSVPEMGLISSSSMPSGFHLPSFGSTLKVGALVEPLTAQMAAALGVESGLMVKQVARKSEAEKAGLRAFDVILKVGEDSIATSADWDRALRANQNMPVQVTILRNKKQQTITLQVDSRRQKSELEDDHLLDPMARELIAELSAEIGPDLGQALAAQAQAASEAAQAQAEALREQMENDPLIRDPEAARQLRQQTEELAECIKRLQNDPELKQLEQQMEEFQKNFHSGRFEANPEQMRQLQQQMQRFREQMEEWNARAEGRFV